MSGLWVAERFDSAFQGAPRALRLPSFGWNQGKSSGLSKHSARTGPVERLYGYAAGAQNSGGMAPPLSGLRAVRRLRRGQLRIARSDSFSDAVVARTAVGS
jgi:hypothetical protein